MLKERIKVLLVEDDRTDQEVFKRLVEKENLPYDYHVVESVAGCREITQNNRFDIVVADYNLGDGNIYDIFSLTKGIPTIVITSEGDRDTAVEAMKSGAYDYLVKDINGSYLRKLPISIKNATEYQQAREALEESKEQYRQIVQLANEGIWIIDQHNITHFVNPKMAEMLGFTPEEMSGMNINRFIKEDDLVVFTLNLSNREKPMSDRYDLVLKKRDGNHIWVIMSFAPVMKQGVYIGALAMVTDITERKKSEEMLAHAILEGEQQERKRLARELHDGFGQLISGLKLHIEALQEGMPISANVLQKIKSIAGIAIKECRAVAHNLMPTALEESGLIKALEEMCDTLSEVSSMKVTFSCNKNDVFFNKTRETEIYRIAQELISNALKHSGGKSILVKLTCMPNNVILEVKDDGKGNIGTKVMHSGGLGMKSIEARVKLLSGDFTIKSKPGLGLTATIEIPVG